MILKKKVQLHDFGSNWGRFILNAGLKPSPNEEHNIHLEMCDLDIERLGTTIEKLGSGRIEMITLELNTDDYKKLVGEAEGDLDNIPVKSIKKVSREVTARNGNKAWDIRNITEYSIHLNNYMPSYRPHPKPLPLFNIRLNLTKEEYEELINNPPVGMKLVSITAEMGKYRGVRSNAK